jgi:hypothetical protein
LRASASFTERALNTLEVLFFEFRVFRTLRRDLSVTFSLLARLLGYLL